jgi:hypothetical protein
MMIQPCLKLPNLMIEVFDDSGLLCLFLFGKLVVNNNRSSNSGDLFIYHNGQLTLAIRNHRLIYSRNNHVN